MKYRSGLPVCPDVQSFHLTNRIRTNAELSSFIQNMMDLSRRKGKNGYPNIEVVYANDDTEAAYLLQGYMRQGYLMVRCEGCESFGGRDG